MKKIAYHPSDDLSIEFDPQYHTYIDDSDNRYTSVTTFVSKFFNPFSAKQTALDCAKKKGSEYYGMNSNDIMAQWEDIADQARLEGTVMHEYAEWLVSGKTQGDKPGFISDRTDRLFFWIEKCVDGLLEKFSFIAAEMIVFSPGTKIAGMVDLLMYDPIKNEVVILDWKQNKEISRDSMFGNALPPIQHLTDDDFNHYALQLSTYRYIMECGGYFNCKFRQAIIHVTETGYKAIPLPYLQCEVQRMILEWDKIEN